jgi:hypothetical protein
MTLFHGLETYPHASKHVKGESKSPAGKQVQADYVVGI